MDLSNNIAKNRRWVNIFLLCFAIMSQLFDITYLKTRGVSLFINRFFLLIFSIGLFITLRQKKQTQEIEELLSLEIEKSIKMFRFFLILGSF